MVKILIINGPNLNLLGKREENIYGNMSFDDFYPKLKDLAKKNNCSLEYFQSNHEGEIIDRIHQGIGNLDHIILNPGALTHYSYSIFDAIRSAKIPVIEIHISNIYTREDWRSRSVISPAATGVISGFGLNGYYMALKHILEI